MQNYTLLDYSGNSITKLLSGAVLICYLASSFWVLRSPLCASHKWLDHAMVSTAQSGALDKRKNIISFSAIHALEPTLCIIAGQSWLASMSAILYNQTQSCFRHATAKAGIIMPFMASSWVLSRWLTSKNADRTPRLSVCCANAHARSQGKAGNRW